MTFTEAAIEVLRREGKPLHFRKIAEIAAREDLLDHVGKIPEETMAGQLAAHCRLPKTDRRMMAVQHGTFALVEWGLDEDPAGIENLIEAPPEDEAPYRDRERHPIPSREVVRASGRGEGRGEGRGRRREEGEDRRPKRFPPPAEVAYEILAGAGRTLELSEIAAQGAERLLMPEAFVRDLGSLRAALQEDNHRRESSGRKALFELGEGVVALAAQPEPGERPIAVAQRPAAGAADLRKTALAALRRRLRECDAPTFEHVAVALLGRLGYQELKAVKRGREHAIYTAKLRLGAAEVRHAVRVLRAHGEVTRRDVQDLRRDVSSYGAQIGVVVATGDVQREARSEACAGGQLPITLLCGEALADAATLTATGCAVVAIPEVDETFFRAAAVAGAEEEAARRVRREERERRDGRRGEDRRREVDLRSGSTEPAAAAEGTPEAEGPPSPEPSGEGQPTIIEVRATIDDEEGRGAESDEGDGDAEGDEEGVEEAAGGPSSGAMEVVAAGGESAEGRKRRRRRRRRRGGRGRREGGAGGAVTGAAGAAGAAPPGEAGASGEAAPAASSGEAPSEGGGARPAEPPSGGEPSAE